MGVEPPPHMRGIGGCGVVWVWGWAGAVVPTGARGWGHTGGMKIALMQDTAQPLDVAGNLAMIEAAAGRAREQGAELLLTPELFPVGYAPAQIRAELSAEQVAQTRAETAAIAQRSGIAMVVSLPGVEWPEERGITAVLFGPDGEVLGEHQKVQLFGPEEKESFRPGSEAPAVIRLGGLNLGMVICYDIEFPEMARAAASAGVEVLLVPTALAEEPQVPQLLVPARALENQMTVAYANHCGLEDGLSFDGLSVVAGPRGEILGELGAEPGLLLAEVGPRPASGEAGPWYLEDRRTELHRHWI